MRYGDYIMMQMLWAALEGPNKPELPTGHSPPWMGDVCKYQNKLWIFQGSGEWGKWIAMDEFIKPEKVDEMGSGSGSSSGRVQRQDQ